jgi:hypothetical protein
MDRNAGFVSDIRLPDFADPPVVETVLGVSFLEVPRLTSTQIVRFWAQHLAEDLPTDAERAPYNVPVERFPAPPPKEEMSVRLRVGPPPTRFMFSDDNHLVQIQSDWFAYNWRKTPARPSGTPPIGVLSEMHWATEWRDETLRQIRNLRWLAAGWDGPASPAMRESTLAVACELVAVLAERMPDLKPPAIVPTPDAGVFIEWYDLTRSIGFTVRDADDVELCYEDAVRGVEWEGHLGSQPNDDWRRILLTHQR